MTVQVSLPHEECGEVALAVLFDGGVELFGHEGVVDGAVDVAEYADGGLVEGVGVGEAGEGEGGGG